MHFVQLALGAVSRCWAVAVKALRVALKALIAFWIDEVIILALRHALILLFVVTTGSAECGAVTGARRALHVAFHATLKM